MRSVLILSKFHIISLIVDREKNKELGVSSQGPEEIRCEQNNRDSLYMESYIFIWKEYY